MMKAKIVFLFLAAFAFKSLAQDNDHCASAMLLEVSSQCNPKNHSSINATAEPPSIAPDPSCGSYAGGDVWFKIIMPASGAIRVEVDNLKGATPPSFTLYSGQCGAFNELVCVRNDQGKTVFNPLLAGDTIYLRVYGFFNETGKEFSLCAYEPSVPENDLCENALLLEVGKGCNLADFSNAYATSQPDSIAPKPSCGFYQGGDVWFKAVMPASGVLRVNKNRISGASHPSMTVYTGNCGHFTEVFCSKNDPIETLNNTSLAGQTLYFRLFSYNDEEGASFSFCLYEEGAPGNDDCENAFLLEADSSCSMSSYSNIQATAQSTATAPNPSCGQYKGTDVWFKTTVPASGKLKIETDNLQGATPPSITIYSGNCGAFQEIACMSNSKEKTLSDSSLANQQLYIRAFTFGSDDGGVFSLCAYEPVCRPDTVDAGKIMLCKDETYQFGTQTLTEAGDYTEIFQNSGGCDSLVTLAVSVKEVNTAIVQDGETLTAQAVGAAYQWMSCTDGNKVIAGETAPIFTANAAGDYAVMVTENGCSDTSACYSIQIVGVADEENAALAAFPNPVGDFLHIQQPQAYGNVWLAFINMKGEVVKTAHFQEKIVAPLDISQMPAGAYILRVFMKNEFTTLKIIKK